MNNDTKPATPPAMNAASPAKDMADTVQRLQGTPAARMAELTQGGNRVAMNAASPTNQCGTCDGNGVVGSPPDQYFNCPECAAMHDCPDCEGSGRISPAELCQRCNESGILPDQGSAPQPCSAFECKAGQQDGILCADDGCDIANGVRCQGSATTGEEFHKHLDKCSAEVATWPAWKRRGGFGQGSATTTDAEQLQAHRADFDRKMADPLHRVLAERASGATSGEARRVTPEMRAALDSSKAEAAEIGARIEQMKEEFGLGSATSGEVSVGAQVMQEFLKWNRSQSTPPVAIPKELFVARKVLELRAALAAKAEQSMRAVLSDKQTQALTLAAATFDALDIAGADDLRSIIKSAPVAEQPNSPALLCDGCGHSIAAHDQLAQCPVAERAAAPASVPEGFALVPTEINAVIRIGFAYVDAAREANPRQKWAFSHAGWNALLAEAAIIARANLAAPEVAQPAAQGGSNGFPPGTECKCGNSFKVCIATSCEHSDLATPAPTAGEPSAKAQRNSEYDAISARARELYVVYVDWVERQGIHSNRLPGWGELSADERASWVSEARLHIKATQGGNEGEG